MNNPFRGRPRIFRDPIHGDIEWPKNAFGDLISRLIDTPAFQRLRHIRQNGVTNLVFHGAEHSRFAHSIGVAWTAAKMLDAIDRNSGQQTSDLVREDTILAALLHDVGHGPFSHTLEEILGGRDNFDHETMTVRFLTDADSARKSRSTTTSGSTTRPFGTTSSGGEPPRTTSCAFTPSDFVAVGCPSTSRYRPRVWISY